MGTRRSGGGCGFRGRTLLVVCGLLALPSAAAAAPVIHAHRGGPLLFGKPAYPEDTMPAFRSAAAEGFVLEMDVKLAKGNVPVVIHDATVDRTTPCEGAVADFTPAQLSGACRSDILGTEGNDKQLSASDPRRAPIPTLAEFLAFAKEKRARINLEIKNIPTDPDFDNAPMPEYARTVAQAIAASGIPPSQVIVQSFWPPNLDVAKEELPGVETSLLTLSQLNDGGPSYASANGYEWVSPAWPVDPGYVEQAHALGRKVVPYTLDTAAAVRDAAEAGVEALITNDPLMAREALETRPGGLAGGGGSGGGGPGARDTKRPTVTLHAPRFASDRSRTPRMRLRWSGRDTGSGIASYTVEVRRVRTSRWRPILRATRRTRIGFRGRAGATYLFRVRARDRAGNSGFDRAKSVAPFDDRRMRFSRGWRRARVRFAYGGTLRRARRPGVRASLGFRGRRVVLIGSRLRRGGRLLVSVDGRERVVRVRGRVHRRSRIFTSRRLRAGRHVLRVRVLRGPVEIDGAAVIA